MSKVTTQAPSRQSMSDVLLNISDLVVMRDKRTIIDHLSFCVKRGEILGLIGPNGAGKSTVLSTIAGIDNAHSGRILLDGRAVADYTDTQRAQVLGWVEQLGTVHWPLSVERLVMLGRIPHLPTWKQATDEDYEAVEAAMISADCMAFRHRQVPSLSGGERSRVLLARALAAQPSVLLADEPVSTLDIGHQLQTMQVLRDYACADRAVVVVMHDLSLAVRYCHRLLLIHKGKLVSIGEPAAVLNNRNIADVYNVSVVTGCTSVPWIVPEHVLDAAR